MTTFTPSWFKTFQATAVAIPLGARVTYDANGLISAAADTAPAIGTTVEAIPASGYGTVLLFGPTRLVVALAALPRAAVLFPVADGEVDDAGTTAIGLIALEAATANHDIIEAADIRTGQD